MTIWTIGHSTHPLPDFISLLDRYSIQLLADIRSYPGSRRYPQFNGAVLAATLREREIEYRHLPELGGRRKPLPDSHNTAWRSPQFRGYADYMETPAFLVAVGKLIDMAEQSRTSIMCAEAVWWKCHRSVLADYLKWRGIEVIHILSKTNTEPHPYTKAARIVEGKLSYRAEDQADLPLFPSRET